MSALRDIAIVAGHELGEALRTRRIWIIGLFYLGGAVAGTLILVDLLAGIEAVVAENLAVASTTRPGSFTTSLMASAEAQRFLTRVVGDAELAAELITLPPLALFYSWLVTVFCPALVMLTSSEAIASDLATGAVRFSLVRTARLTYSVGKLVGQSALLGVGILFGALGVFVTGYFSFDGFAPATTALWLLALGGRGFVYCLPYVGLALGLSHLTRSVPWSRALGLLALAATGIAWGVLHMDWTLEHAGPLARMLTQLLPGAHRSELWRPALSDRLPALLMLSALCVVYFSLGYRFRARRDA